MPLAAPFARRSLLFFAAPPFGLATCNELLPGPTGHSRLERGGARSLLQLTQGVGAFAVVSEYEDEELLDLLTLLRALWVLQRSITKGRVQVL